MNEETEKSGARSAIVLAVLVVLVAIFCVEYGLQTLVWMEAKRWASINQWLADVPQRIPAPTALPKGTEVRAYGYEFLAPWPGNIKPQPAITSTAFHFDAGQVIVFFDPGTEVDTLHALQTSNQALYVAFANVFSAKPFETNYDLYKAVYEASPAQASPFGDRGESLRLNQLLLWKLSFGIDAPGGISAFDFGKNHGFQFGDPAKGLPVAARVFTDRDVQFRITFAVADGSSGKITQDDVDSVVQSLQHIPIDVH